MHKMQVRSESSWRYPGWRVVAVCHLGVLTGFATVFIYSFSLMVKPLQHEFGWNREQVSRAFSVAAISVAIPPVVPVSFAFSVYHNVAGMYDGSTVTDYPQFLTTDGGGNVWFSMSANAYVNAISNSGAAISPAGATANSTAGFTGSVCANCTFQGMTQTYQRSNSLSISRPAVDQSGNVWVPVSGVGSTYVDLLVGIATPKVNPDSLGLKNGTFGSQP